MARPNVYWFYNSTTNNVAKTAGSGEDANFKSISPGIGPSAHTLVWTGSAVMDGDPTGSRDNIIVPDTGNVEIPKTFIDNGTTVDQVPLAGTSRGGQQGGANRYVFCLHIDGPTQSQPFLEFWDNENHNSVSSKVLGNGTPNNSFIKGIATTNGAPSAADWVASGEHRNLAGDGTTNRLELDSGNLTGPKELYFNLGVRVPAGAGAFNENPFCTLRFAYS